MRRIVLVLTFVLVTAPLWAQGTVMPQPVFLALDSNGDPINNAKLCVYAAGTTTPATTYTSSALTTANNNPVRTDSAGLATVFLAPGTSYKFVLKTAGSDNTCDTGSTVWTRDGISGVPTTSGNTDVLGTAGEALTAGQAVYLSDGSGGKVAGSWYKTDSAQTYSSTLPLIGIVPASVSSGSAGTIRLAGQATGLSSLSVGATYYVTSTAGALSSTAPANRRIVGVADSTSSLVLIPALPASATTSTITTVGTQIALAIPAGDGALTIFANNATPLTVQGITAGRDGQSLTIYSVGAGQVDLANQSGSATAELRLINGVTGTISLAAGSGRVVLQYDSTTARWRVREHEQGAWITPTFAAGTYTGVGGGTWTVGSGDVTTQAYRLSGRTLQVVWALVTTTVAGTVGNLSIGNAAWGGFTAAKAMSTRHGYSDNGGAEVLGSATVSAAGAAILINRLAGSNWTAATDTTGTNGMMTFEVQ